MPETIRLTSDASSAIVSTFGAEPLAWSVAGRDLLWPGDPAFWPRVSPVLFPTVGRVRGGELRVDGKTYPMDIHGFAPESEFLAAERSSDSVRLVLADNDETRRRYPFAFRLEITYRLTGEALSAEFRIVNPGGKPLPYALGFHPGFRWPFFGEGGREGHAIEFEVAEEPAVPVITKDGLFSSEKQPVPLQGRRLPLDEKVLAKDALCFLDAKSLWVRLVGPGGAIRMSAENFSHWALWSLPAAPFVSIEAWTGHGDPDGFAGDIAEKPSMRFLEPGGESVHRVEFRWQPAS